jgi:hypothetical protein
MAPSIDIDLGTPGVTGGGMTRRARFHTVFQSGNSSAAQVGSVGYTRSAMHAQSIVR